MNPLKEFAIDLTHKFKVIKTFNEGDGFRIIGLAQSCTFNATKIMRLIKQYVSEAEKADGLSGELDLEGKTVKIVTDVELTSVSATYIGSISSFLLVNITSVEGRLEGIDSPYILDIYVSIL